MSCEPRQGQIKELQQDLLRLSNRLGGLAAVQSENDPPSADLVKRVISARRLRGRFLAQDLFGEPGWDMLLELYLARLEGRSVSVTSVGISAEVPATTALRWIKVLMARGLVSKMADSEDDRRKLLTLSDDAATGVERYLREGRRLALFG